MSKICVFVFCLFCLPSTAQDYPKDYFRNPLDIPILLAGNFGECRTGHFHSGLDIKTQGKENLPVYAAAEGYISRIKMEKGGFGHALYITHPNGYTTLYAHLNNFVEPIQAYLRRQQYRKESWAIDLSLSPDQFPVKKGDQVAFSGNTGASTAPHLHFEIRDSKTEHPLNGSLFGFPIKDTKAPVAKRLAIYDGHQMFYTQSPDQYTVKTTGQSNFNKDTIVVHSNLIGAGIVADDYMDESSNTLAFYRAKLWLDDSLQCNITLDDIGYDETRYLHAYADYKTKKQDGFWVQCFFKLKGNALAEIYNPLNAQQGFIQITEGLHQLRIELTDAFENTTSFGFYLSCNNIAPPVLNGDSEILHAGKQEEFNKYGLRFSLPATTLYDDQPLTLSNSNDTLAYSQRYELLSSYIPAHSYFDLYIRPDKPIPFTLTNKIALVYNDGKEDDGIVAEKQKDGSYKARIRNFGSYRLMADTTAPVISSLNGRSADLSKAKRITFKVVENLSSVKSFRAELDGKWLLFEPGANTFFYDFDEHCNKGQHKLLIKARDENGNESSLEYSFSR